MELESIYSVTLNDNLSNIKRLRLKWKKSDYVIMSEIFLEPFLYHISIIMNIIGLYSYYNKESVSFNIIENKIDLEITYIFE